MAEDNIMAPSSSSSSSPPQQQQQQQKEPFLLRVAVGSSNPSKIRAAEQALERVLPALSTCTTASTTTTTDIGNNGSSSSNNYKLDIQGFTVSSNVNDQPYGDEETKLGAMNRSKAAYVSYFEKEGHYPHLAFGMEGGLEWHDNCSTTTIHTSKNGITSTSNSNDNKKKDLYCMAWMSVYGRRTPFIVNLFAAAEEEKDNNNNNNNNSVEEDTEPIYGIAKTASFALPPEITRLVHEKGMELGHADDQVFRRVNSKRGSGTVGILTRSLIDRSEYYDHALLLAFIPWLQPSLYPYGIH